jgi:hypothetical protein
MRKAMLLLAVLGLASSLWAADPSLGTWKLNIAQSTFSPNRPAPKEETVVGKAVGDQIEVTITGTAADGSPLPIKFTHPAEGGVLKADSSPLPPGVTVVVTVVEPGNFYWTFLKDGKQMRLNHFVVSKDGETTRETIKGVSCDGKTLDELLLWDKQ